MYSLINSIGTGTHLFGPAVMFVSGTELCCGNLIILSDVWLRVRWGLSRTRSTGRHPQQPLVLPWTIGRTCPSDVAPGVQETEQGQQRPDLNPRNPYINTEPWTRGTHIPKRGLLVQVRWGTDGLGQATQRNAPHSKLSRDCAATFSALTKDSSQSFR